MFSALPSNSDMARRSRHVANVQDLEVADLQPTSRGTGSYGAGKGPVTSATIKGLFDKKEIESDGQVRRKGMSESKSLRQRICVNLRIHPNAQPVAKINLDQPKVGRLGSTT